ncbi:MAG: polysaccharide biosynthesis/export family protein [Bacteroidales bacterium]|nr:polysaccharide biosynthesis/export family protein [Bacteroidales bacterium]
MKKANFIILLTTLMLCSCASIKDINYFQDSAAGDANAMRNASYNITIQPGDRITVLVSSKDLELAMPFNLITVNNTYARSNNSGSLNSTNYTQYYTVSQEGEINMPILGKVKVTDLTRTQIEEKISGLIIASENGFKDPTVTVDYANLNVKMLGEVNHPGAVIIDRDQFTLMDAISKAGDLSIFGNRKNVKVYRVENGEEKVYEVDLTQRKQVINSPVYMLRQNDIVYVEPNKTRARQSTSSGNNFLQPSVWISTASLITTVIALIVK